MLQYGDDTIFLLQDDTHNAKNMKFILSAFEQMSGLKINFHKTELILFDDVVKKQQIHQEKFTCNIGELPMRY